MAKRCARVAFAPSVPLMGSARFILRMVGSMRSNAFFDPPVRPVLPLPGGAMGRVAEEKTGADLPDRSVQTNNFPEAERRFAFRIARAIGGSCEHEPVFFAHHRHPRPGLAHESGEPL